MNAIVVLNVVVDDTDWLTSCCCCFCRRRCLLFLILVQYHRHHGIDFSIFIKFILDSVVYFRIYVFLLFETWGIWRRGSCEEIFLKISCCFILFYELDGEILCVVGGRWARQDTSCVCVCVCALRGGEWRQEDTKNRATQMWVKCVDDVDPISSNAAFIYREKILRN